MSKRLKSDGFWVRGVDLKYPEFSATPADDFVVGDSVIRTSVACRSTGDLMRCISSPPIWAEPACIFYRAARCRDPAQLRPHKPEYARGLLSRRNIKRIFYSSSAAYIHRRTNWIRKSPNCAEDSAYPANPDSDYGREKLFSERLYWPFNAIAGWKCVSRDTTTSSDPKEAGTTVARRRRPPFAARSRSRRRAAK